MTEPVPADASQNPGGDDPAVSYGAAVAELDQILADLERDDLDVDILAERVRRAALLLGWCRQRIRAATDDVEAAVAALGGSTVTDDDASEN